MQLAHDGGRGAGDLAFGLLVVEHPSEPVRVRPFSAPLRFFSLQFLIGHLERGRERASVCNTDCEWTAGKSRIVSNSP
eukprot:5125752-Pleurochrysis_carterae.AAC.1